MSAKRRSLLDVLPAAPAAQVTAQAAAPATSQETVADPFPDAPVVSIVAGGGGATATVREVGQDRFVIDHGDGIVRTADQAGVEEFLASTVEEDPEPEEAPIVVSRPRAKYARLEAKEARLRTDQREDLGALARRLERARPTGTGERITENTLIRVAIDVLLAMGDRLDGVDEDQVLAAARRAVQS